MGHWEGSERSRRYTLGKAAQQGELVIVRCNRCHKSATFLADDLRKMFNPLRDVYQPPFKCSSCKQIDLIKVTVRQPLPGDYGNLVVRRPAGVRKTQLWRTVKLGDH